MTNGKSDLGFTKEWAKQEDVLELMRELLLVPSRAQINWDTPIGQELDRLHTALESLKRLKDYGHHSVQQSFETLKGTVKEFGLQFLNESLFPAKKAEVSLNI